MEWIERDCRGDWFVPLGSDVDEFERRLLWRPKFPPGMN